MKKHCFLFFLASVFILTGVVSCKKINEATELGGDLIPAVDNINTFEVSLNTVTDNLRYLDTTRIFFTDLVALGNLNDPEFGQTHTTLDFNLLPFALGTYPFVSKDSTKIIDSVVLSLAYVGSYGDTANGTQTLRVFELDPNSGFRHDTLYKFSDPATDFTTTGSELGSKTFSVSSLKDSFSIIRKDTAILANVVRIKLNNSIGDRFATYDTTTGPLGGYHLDSTGGNIFRNLFKGLAVKADNSGNVLSYFNLSGTNSKLTVYYKILHSNGVIDLLSTDFTHRTNGQANYIKTTPAALWASYLNGSSSDDKIYLQSAPSGSYASILIPELSTFGNKLIHRAEIIVTKLPSPSENIFTAPSRLFLDRTNKGNPDTAFLFQNDLPSDASGALDFASFGGTLSSTNTYTFNISRYVQGVVTRHEPNDTLRLYAPFRTQLYNSNFRSYGPVSIISAVGAGRVVLAGGSYQDQALRLRLRIIYSNL